MGTRATLGAAQVAAMLEMAEKRAKVEGKAVPEVILDVVYDLEASQKDRLTACKLWMDLTTVKISEGGEADKALGPSVFLPEHRASLSVIAGGKGA